MCVSPHLCHPLVIDLRVRERQRRQPGQAREDAAQPRGGRLVLQRDVVAGEAPEGVNEGRAGVYLRISRVGRIRMDREDRSYTHAMHDTLPTPALTERARSSRARRWSSLGVAGVSSPRHRRGRQPWMTREVRERSRGAQHSRMGRFRAWRTREWTPWGGIWIVRWVWRVVRRGDEEAVALTSHPINSLSPFPFLPDSSARPRCPPAAPPRAGASAVRSHPRGRRPRRPAAPAIA